ncbi:MAG TPA: CDGSH iron-sulfur domain-containing protein, partial [Methanomassiliicoccales archaeon]|nr:CDGSH iron-sulfur domain-containing protein [Methanomassiliicoccales archaeon]
KGNDAPRIKVSKDGPYLVTGRVPLMEQIVVVDDDGVPCAWNMGKRYPLQNAYSLCRCGHSKKKPFCDGAHSKAKFNSKENGRGDFAEKGTKRFEGPTLELTDIRPYCSVARFCHRGKGIWQLTVDSADPKARSAAIEIASNCPGGRLVEKDMASGEIIEPELEPSIGVVLDPSRKEDGPLWVRGGIQVEGSDGFLYKRRNRVTLCRCGESEIMPFCDSSHALE